MYSGGDVVKIQGTWINGFLDGEARIEFTTGGYMEGFYLYGVQHGVSRTFGIGGYLKEIRCVLSTFSIYNIIIIIGFIFTVIGNIRICNIVHWYKKHKKT